MSSGHEVNDAGHSHDEGHDEGHATTFQPDIKEPSEEWEFLEIALRELLIEKKILSAREIADEIEAWEKKTPENGARVVARAWCDGDYMKRLLADGNAAVAELGFEFDGLKLVAVANTASLHHMVVCTLCSCYPRPPPGGPTIVVQIQGIPLAHGPRTACGAG